MSEENLSRLFLVRSGRTLDEYICSCNRLADDVINYFGGGEKLWIFNPVGLLSLKGELGDQFSHWYFHSVSVFDGVIHDPYVRDLLPVNAYLRKYINHDIVGLLLDNNVIQENSYTSDPWGVLQRKRSLNKIVDLANETGGRKKFFGLIFRMRLEREGLEEATLWMLRPGNGYSKPA
jgi:hypothetical protein